MGAGRKGSGRAGNAAKRCERKRAAPVSNAGNCTGIVQKCAAAGSIPVVLKKINNDNN